MFALKLIWKFLGLALTIQYFYWAVLFAGAWLGINAAPSVSNDWMALGFCGAGMLMAEITFPSLASLRIDRRTGREL